MSPDIHWHVGEDAEHETVVSSTPERRPLRSWLAILVVVLLGVGLGALYRSIPDPAPRPTSLPTLPPAPTHPAIPAKLFETIDREALALAAGDFGAYLDVHTPGEPVVRRQDFTAWGRPGDERPLYVVVDFALRTDTAAWADIRQFRDGRYFRETRFYVRSVDRWFRRWDPDIFFWRGQEDNLQTPHFDVTYAVEDRDVLSPTLRQLEDDYPSLCRDLGCARIGHELTFTLKVKADEGPNGSPAGTGNSEIRLPSPRVAGFFESGRAYHWYQNGSHFTLALAMVEQIYGPVSGDRPGASLLWAGLLRAIERIDPLPAELWKEIGDLKQESLLPLDKLWEMAKNAEPTLALVQTYHLLRFIEQQYGAAAVTQILGTIDSAKSMPEAIETGTGAAFTEFDRQWQAWAKQNIPSR